MSLPDPFLLVLLLKLLSLVLCLLLLDELLVRVIDLSPQLAGLLFDLLDLAQSFDLLYPQVVNSVPEISYVTF